MIDFQSFYFTEGKGENRLLDLFRLTALNKSIGYTDKNQVGSVDAMVQCFLRNIKLGIEEGKIKGHRLVSLTQERLCNLMENSPLRLYYSQLILELIESEVKPYS
jgi:hypothetical protein